MKCSWCGSTGSDVKALFEVHQGQLFARFLPDVSQTTMFCAACRMKVENVIDEAVASVRKESLAKVCCRCGMTLQGIVSHGYCKRCREKTEKGE